MTELILALDVIQRSRALEIARSCSPYLDAIKIGYPLVLSSNLSIAHELAKFDRPLIADFKVADIPSTNTLICEQVFKAGFDAVIVHGFPGEDSIRACVESAHAHGGSVYVVAEMSHPGAVEFFPSVAERIARLAVDSGAEGIIAPATRPDRIALLRGIVRDRKIYTPGVGVQGGDLEEAAALADGVIVGRSIYNAPDPAAAAERLSRICRGKERSKTKEP